MTAVHICPDNDCACCEVIASCRCAGCRYWNYKKPAMTAPTDAIEPCPELNLSNYNEDDVAALNDWAVRAADLIEQMQAAPAQEAIASCGYTGLCSSQRAVKSNAAPPLERVGLTDAEIDGLMELALQYAHAHFNYHGFFAPGRGMEPKNQARLRAAIEAALKGKKHG